MAKHRKYKGGTCHGSAKVIGNHVTVKATCPIKGTKATVTKNVKRSKATSVPSQCKGLKKSKRRACAKEACMQRPKEYRGQCLKAAGLRK